MARTLCFLLLPLLSHLSLAQFPPTPTGLTVIKSQVDPEVTISFKQAEICERTPGVTSYSGYVHLPSSVLSDVGDYDINSYFIFFEARHDAGTAPLGIYLAGGPGESSLYAAMSSESGPCYVNFEGTDTINNPWSFNNHVNMLYIDQPVKTGYSYDKLINATSNPISGGGIITPIDAEKAPLPPTNATFGYGTYPSQSFETTTNNTVQSARALWHFAEHWLASFPHAPKSNKVSVWGNSYGGYWVPETAAQFSKNFKKLPADHPLKCKDLKIDTIGITNGCIDFVTSAAGWPEYAYNNTYGVKFGSEALYEEALHNLTKSGGCLDLVNACRALGEKSDPSFNGNDPKVNTLCEEAFGFCSLYVIASFPKLFYETDNFDIATPQPAPCDFYLPVVEYLNTASVQQALGVPLNFTYDSDVVTANFGVPSSYTRPPSATTGDAARQNGLPNIEYLLENDVKIAFIFGDRDYRCPWTGGEATALAAKWEHQDDFANAGYEMMQGIETPQSVGGLRALVKQYGQFSFSRVMDAGHAVSAYAPETVYRIFDRTINGVDVVTGEETIGDGYHTMGPKTSWQWRNTLPKKAPETCMIEGQFQKRLPPGSS